MHAKHGQKLRELCEGPAMTRQALSPLEERTSFLLGQARKTWRCINPVSINEIADRWMGQDRSFALHRSRWVKEDFRRR
jgi:hypothetical protein